MWDLQIRDQPRASGWGVDGHRALSIHGTFWFKTCLLPVSRISMALHPVFTEGRETAEMPVHGLKPVALVRKSPAPG